MLFLIVQAGTPKPAKPRQDEEAMEAEDAELSAERWVIVSNCKRSALYYRRLFHDQLEQSVHSVIWRSAGFLHQAEGVQVLAVRSVPGRPRSVREDEDPDGRHQQGASDRLHGARGSSRFGSHAGRQPGHGG